MSGFKFSIQTKFFLVLFFTLLFWLILSLIFMDAANRYGSRAEMLTEVTEFNAGADELQRSLNLLIMASADLDSSVAVIGLADECQTQLGKMEDHLRQFERTGLFMEYPEASESLPGLLETCMALRSELSTFSGPSPRRTKTLALLISSLNGQCNEFTGAAFAIFRNTQRDSKLQIIISLVLGLFLIALILYVFGRHMQTGLGKLSALVRQLSGGQIPEEIRFDSGDEFEDITRQLNAYASDLREKIHFLQAIGEGAEDMSYMPSPNDRFGKALLELAHHLRQKDQDALIQQKEEEYRNWSSEGVAQLGDILRSELENVRELSYRIIQMLVSYLKVEMGSLLLSNDTHPEAPVLESVASYAYDRRKLLQKEFRWGEGLPGTCALEQDTIFITDVPEDYYQIISGTGQILPNSILLVPLKLEDKVFGVIELASVRILASHEVKFVETVAEGIASTLSAVKINEKTAALLKQSRQQEEILKSHKEKMDQGMKELELAQEASRKKEVEITGILNAVNQSSMVVEYGLNGRIASVNDHLVWLLESSRDQIVGKHHSDFARVDKYSDEYKTFWSDLKNGKSISKEELFTLYSGKEVWLQESFTPVMDEDGKVFKILCIASDITENKVQQKNLEIQAGEIKRRSREMETLNEAVDASIIKCELDAEGIITDLNQNFSDASGYSRKEMLGRNYRLFLKDIEKDQFEKIWLEVHKEKTYEGVMRRTRPTGEETWLMSTFSPVKDENGSIYKIYFLALDITEKKLKYQLLEDANKEVERLRNKLRSYEDVQD